LADREPKKRKGSKRKKKQEGRTVLPELKGALEFYKIDETRKLARSMLSDSVKYAC
jgi:hypothetical protein